VVITDIFNVLKLKNVVDFQIFRKLYFPTAKRVRGETSSEGSNPSLSARKTKSPIKKSGFFILTPKT